MGKTIFLSSTKPPPNILDPKLSTSTVIPKSSSANISKLSTSAKAKLEASSGMTITNDADLQKAKDKILADSTASDMADRKAAADFAADAKAGKDAKMSVLSSKASSFSDGLADAMALGQATKDVCPDWMDLDWDVSCPWFNFDGLKKMIDLQKYKDRVTGYLDKALGCMASLGSGLIDIFGNIVRCSTYLAANAASKVTGLAKSVAGIGNHAAFGTLVSVLDANKGLQLNLDDPLGMARTVLKNGNLPFGDVGGFKSTLSKAGLAPGALLGTAGVPLSASSPGSSLKLPFVSMDSFMRTTGLGDNKAVQAYTKINAITTGTSTNLGIIGSSNYPNAGTASGSGIFSRPAGSSYLSGGAPSSSSPFSTGASPITISTMSVKANPLAVPLSPVSVSSDVKPLSADEQQRLVVMSELTGKSVAELEMAYVIATKTSAGDILSTGYNANAPELFLFANMAGLTTSQSAYVFGVGDLNSITTQKQLSTGLTALVNNGYRLQDVMSKDDIDKLFVFDAEQKMTVSMQEVAKTQLLKIEVTPASRYGTDAAKIYATNYNGVTLDKYGMPIYTYNQYGAAPGYVQPGSSAALGPNASVLDKVLYIFGATPRYDANVNKQAIPFFNTEYGKLIGMFT
jgi:hypothetical protein